ncbi:MAG: HAMP domain-containing histidine kinase [Acidobacteria bacterium]|nr:HAMP domain-containing histidine kinase [Acidobacteriota bacterium]
MRPPPFVVRALARLLAGGLALLVVALGGGALLERWRLSPTDDAARERVAQSVTASLHQLEAELQVVIDRLQVDDADLLAAAQGEFTAQRRLFDALAAAAPTPRTGLSMTIYGTAADPLAWTGQPTDLPDLRVQGPEAVFLAPDAQGLRLVRVHPLPVAQGSAERTGAFVLETPIAAGDPGGLVTIPSIVGGVPVRYLFESAALAPDEFALTSRAGTPLAAVRVPQAQAGDSRATFRSRTAAVALAIAGVVLLLLTGPLLDWRRVTRHRQTGIVLSLGVAALILLARLVAGQAIAMARLPLPPLLEGNLGWLSLFFSSPLHFVASSLTLAALAALVASSADLWRLSARRGSRPWPEGLPAGLLFAQVVAGVLATVLVVGYQAFIRFGVAATSIDILHFGLQPWDGVRLAVLVGLLLLNAAVAGLAVLVLRLALTGWAVTRGPLLARVLVWAAWTAGAVAVLFIASVRVAAPWWTTVIVLTSVAVAAWRVGAVRVRLRNASQATRLLALFLGLVLPSLAFYPSVVDGAGRARRQLVESRYAPEVLDQRRTLQAQLAQALRDIDGVADLAGMARVADTSTPGDAPSVEAAFLVWSQTALARQSLTSSIELFDRTGVLASRFALKLPDLGGIPPDPQSGCAWDIFEEVSPLFAEERRLLHAGRALCETLPNGQQRPTGWTVVHLVLDYSNLSFVSAQSPYVALLRAGRTSARPTSVFPVTLSVYGWSGKALYSSAGRSWGLDEAVFTRASQDREPFWATLDRDGRKADAYVLNDRGAIYVLSSWTVTGLDHLIVGAELVSLAFLLFVIAVIAAIVFGAVAGRTPTSGRMLFREVRASFYRKLFLAFVAAAIVPVVALALFARAYFASLLFADIEMEAMRTATTASRVVQDFGNMQSRGEATLLADDLVVWLSRIIAQDVNIFSGPRLFASSERNLFASRLLSSRTPADLYRAILLDGRPSFVGRASAGPVAYLVAAAPVRLDLREAILMVPLTSRQQEVETQIEELDRRVLLAALLFVMLGASIGYSMAERIADPVNRLMRATRRIARGDLDARVLATSADELRRLVEAFNGMAEDLRRQRAELARTNRLAAWADMARQVAHDIKNPLTPIQLNAEHLQRVHADRGRPLGTLVDDCVASILGQVRLLRQISSEFSSFAITPEAHPAALSLRDLVQQLIDPYRAGLEGRLTFAVDVPDTLPLVWVDRLLLGRALTNIVENALHAMGSSGELRFTAAVAAGGSRVSLEVTDTGVGMTPEQVQRIFEPYFSTKTTGTGLGLTIAKRNIEALNGTIDVTSAPGRGTTVTLALPTDA